ncbi:Xaa-Pro peptidase family protein [Bacillus sp. Marseille-Q3570]|uniref:M24 family metallopeptidase n=1 Tax=Bacillus sp. Marseille-Q3570 TaxID=2963522 RepID=UPI0021B7EA67|nr:Xaa-Pro peptidase family protein [Bacillus sp. Marseille-Q3570]
MNIKKHIEVFRSYLKENDLTAAVVMLPDHQYYLTGFRALIYSRPIYLVVDAEKSTLIVPGLEELHALQKAEVDHVEVYYEHPEEMNTNQMKVVKEVLTHYPHGTRVGLDLGSAPASLYQFLSDLDFSISDVGEQLVRMRYIKDEEEIEMMKKAGELVNLGVKTSIEACMEGTSELEIDSKGNLEIYKKASNAYQEAILDLVVMSPSGKVRTTLPHVFSNTRRFEKGDVIIHSRQVALNGYRAELERTIFVGEPDQEQKKIFEVATEAQLKALEFIRPGVKASDVDKVARDVIKKADLEKYAVHRTGHGLGISAHEEPYVRFDNDLILEEGMVFCIEPGIYVPGIGGFRHSDTVVIREHGVELITEYPKTLNQLILQ